RADRRRDRSAAQDARGALGVRRELHPPAAPEDRLEESRAGAEVAVSPAVAVWSGHARHSGSLPYRDRPTLGGMADPPRLSDQPTPFEALAAVARTLGESIDLRQVFARVAEAARTVVPFERMRVLLHDGEGFRIHASEQDGAPGWEDGHFVPYTDISPA